MLYEYLIDINVDFTILIDSEKKKNWKTPSPIPVPAANRKKKNKIGCKRMKILNFLRFAGCYIFIGNHNIKNL